MKQCYIFICCFLMAANLTFGQCLQAPSGMLSWWTADGNTNDISGSNNGNLFNGASYATGKVGQGFSFDGVDDYVQASAINLPTGNSNRTLMCWAKVNAIVTSEAFFAGYGSFGSFTQTYQIGTTTNNNLVFFSQWGQQIVGPTLQTGVWYHIAVSNTGNFTTLYLNGNVVATGNLNINTAIGTQFNIGRIPGSLGNYRRLNGMVDEVQVFDRALAQSEIQTIFNAGGDGVCKPCNITANAGPDTTIFSGQSVQIGSAPVAGNIYSWTPATGLSDANIANPVASPVDSITYSLSVTNANGCSGTDEIKVIVLPVPPGSTCLNPIPFTPTNTCNPINFTMSGNEMWFSFVADTSDLQIILDNTDSSSTIVTKLSLYENNCSGSNLLKDTTIPDYIDTLTMLASGLIPGNTYLLKFEKNGIGYPQFALCINKELVNGTTLEKMYINVSTWKDSVIHIVWDEYQTYRRYFIERSFDGINFLPVNNMYADTLDDIWSNGITAINNDQIYYSTETGNGRFFYNEILKINLQNLRYRIKLEKYNGDYAYSFIKFNYLPNAKPPLPVLTECPTQTGQPSNGFEYLNYYEISILNCCSLTYAAYGVKCLPTNITCQNALATPKDCACDCYSDPCCAHNCDLYNQCTCGGSIYSAPVAAGTAQWVGCNKNPFIGGVYFEWVLVNIKPLFDFAVTTTAACQGQSNGNATVNVTGGGTPFSYLWSDGQNTATAYNLSEGLYTVTVTAANGCTEIAEVTIPFFHNPTAHAGPDQQIICGTGSAILGFGSIFPFSCTSPEGFSSATGGASPYTYNWNVSPLTGQQYLSSSNTCLAIFNFANNAAAGTYTVTLTVTDATGCSDDDEVIITVIPLPLILTNTNTNCSKYGTGTATVSITNGVAPFTYLWSNGQASSTATGLLAGTYSVTVTDANGCNNNATTLITLSPSPTITSITSTKDCEGGVGDGSATVNATGGTTPYSYLWSNQQEWQTATGLTSGLYSVTVTDIKGCSSTGNVTVLQNNMPLPQIIGNNNDCKLGSYYSAYNPNPTLYGYEWSISEGTLDCSVCTATSIIWSIPPGSSGSITLTVTDFETGCQISTTMIVFSCCDGNYPGNDLPPMPYTEFYNSTISTVQNHIGKKIIIAGILTVNANLTFENCQVFLSPDAKILVGPNVAFVCTTTTTDFTKRTILQAGCDIMWDGIYLASNTSVLTIASNSESIPTTIMHAKNAVVSKAGGSYTIMRSKFDLNLRDIVQQNDAGSTEVIILNQFLCTGPMLPYYSGNMQLTAPRTSVGIELTDVPQINIGVTGYGNTFNNMDFGIKSINSSVTVKKNLFQNITFRQLPCPPPSSCQVNGGIAIWARGDKAYNRILIVGGSSNSEQNKIMNCSVGIRAEDQINISVEKNTFDIQNLQFTPETGVLVQNCSGKNISIKTNTFTKFKVGIDCKKIALSNVLIQSNTMNNYLYPIPHICLAISVRDAIIFSMPFPPVTFGSTLISNNKISSVGRGIFLGGSNMAQIRENRINFSHLTGTTEPAQPHYGIQVTKSNNTLIAQNTVERVGMNPTLGYSTKLFGISLETSDNCSVNNNNLTKLGTGVRFFNTFAKASLLCNMMQNCQRGVTLENCDIQDQGTYSQPQDNKWIYQGFTRDADIRGLGTTQVGLRNWRIRSFGLPYEPTVQKPIGTNNIFLGNQQAQIICTNPCGTANPCKQASLLPVAENTAPFNTYPPEAQFLAKQSAFEQLRDEPGLMQLSTPDDVKLQQFHDNMLQINTGKIREVKEHISNNDLLLAKLKNEAILSSNTMEENHKKVNDVYLRTWAVEKFEIDAADRNVLEAVAYQNPMEGGRAVYSARVMLDTILDDFAPEISARKAGQEQESKEQILPFSSSKQPFISEVYPNPNDGNMQLDYQLESEQTGILMIYDIIGQKIKTYTLRNDENTLKISEAALKDGVYFYEIRVNDELIISDKLVIIK